MRHATVGFVGAGRVVEENYLGALTSSGVRVLLYDQDGRRARQLAARPFVKVVDRFEQLGHADLVVVATPARTHATIGQRLLDQTGARVLLEKPPVTSTQELVELQSRDRERRVATAWIRRAFPATKLAQRWLADLVAAHGCPRQVEIWEGTAHKWRSRGAATGVGGLDPLVWDELSHPLDLTFRLLGDGPWTVGETCTTRSDQLAVDATIQLAGRGGPVRLEVHASREESYAGALRLRGPFGVLTLFSGLNGWVRLRSPDGSVEVRRPDEARPLDRIILGSVDGGARSEAVGRLDEWAAPLRVAEAIGTTG